MESALHRIGSLPARSHRRRLEHALELYLGTARLVQAEWSWDVAGLDEARAHLTRAEALSPDSGDWKRDCRNPRVTAMLEELDPASSVALLAGVSLRIAELRGVPDALVDSWWQRLHAIELTRAEHGPPIRDLSTQGAQNEPYVFRYNDLTETCLARGEFSPSAGMADLAMTYSDSAWARRDALHANDSAMGSVATMRGRAFLLRGQLRARPADFDSALVYFEHSFVYRGPERPVVFAETNRLLAKTLLAQSQVASRGARGALLSLAATAGRRAVLALEDSAYVRDRAESRSVLGEVLLARALEERTIAYADSVQQLLIANGSVFSPALTPRAYRCDQVLRARLQRVRWTLTGDEVARSAAGELATRVRDLSLFAPDSLTLRLANAEVQALRSR